MWLSYRDAHLLAPMSCSVQQLPVVSPLPPDQIRDKAVHPRVRYDEQASKLPYMGIVELLIYLTLQRFIARWLLTVGENCSVFLAWSWRDGIQKVHCPNKSYLNWTGAEITGSKENFGNVKPFSRKC